MPVNLMSATPPTLFDENIFNKTPDQLEAEGKVVPVYFMNIFKRGYEAFFETTAMCDSSPSFFIWRTGWAEAFRDFTADVRKNKQTKAAKSS